jgi:cell division protein FtsZ
MRVSVVATGLAQEVATGEAEGMTSAAEPERQTYGFTGKQPDQVKVVHPAPMAARTIAAQRPVVEETEEVVEEAPRVAASAAGRVQVSRTMPRMPQVNEFPPIAQKQIAAQQGRIETIAHQAFKKKPGIFERLASVGLGRKEEPAAQRATTAQRAEPAMAARTAPRVSAPAPQPQPAAVEESYEDDQLAIPAFLRRQAHG